MTELKEKKKSKTQSRDDYHRREMWILHDDAMNLNVLAAKKGMTYKQYCEEVLTEHSRKNKA